MKIESAFSSSQSVYAEVYDHDSTGPKCHCAKDVDFTNPFLRKQLLMSIL